MKVPKLGDQEMSILNYIGDRPSVTVREVAAHFEKEQGLARTTISTMMERLRKKGLLSRKQLDGSFQYSVKIQKDRMLKEKVGEFIQRTLGGSMSPLLNYFVESPNLTPAELEQLKALVAKMDGRRE